MTGRDLKEWLEKRTEEQLDFEVFGGAPHDGEYDPLEKMCIAEMDDGNKAIFLEPLPVEDTNETDPLDADAKIASIPDTGADTPEEAE